MAEVASKLWPGGLPIDNRSKVKQLFAAKDMRGSTAAWCALHGVQDVNSVLDIAVNTSGWGYLPKFTVRNYFQAITESLDDIDGKWTRVTDFISE